MKKLFVVLPLAALLLLAPAVTAEAGIFHTWLQMSGRRAGWCWGPGYHAGNPCPHLHHPNNVHRPYRCDTNTPSAVNVEQPSMVKPQADLSPEGPALTPYYNGR